MAKNEGSQTNVNPKIRISRREESKTKNKRQKNKFNLKHKYANNNSRKFSTKKRKVIK